MIESDTNMSFKVGDRVALSSEDNLRKHRAFTLAYFLDIKAFHSGAEGVVSEVIGTSDGDVCLVHFKRKQGRSSKFWKRGTYVPAAWLVAFESVKPSFCSQNNAISEFIDEF